MRKNIFILFVLSMLTILTCGGDDAEPNFALSSSDAKNLSADDNAAVAQMYTNSVTGVTSLLKAAREGNAKLFKNAATFNCSGGGSLSFDAPTLAEVATIATNGGTFTVTTTAADCAYTVKITTDSGSEETYTTAVSGTMELALTVPAGGYTASDLGTGRVIQTLAGTLTGTNVTLEYEYTADDGSKLVCTDTSTFSVSVNPANSDLFMTGEITTSGACKETVDGIEYSGTCDAIATVGVDTTLNPEAFTNDGTIQGTVEVTCTDSTGLRGCIKYSYAVEYVGGIVTTITTTPSACTL